MRVIIALAFTALAASASTAIGAPDEADGPQTVIEQPQRAAREATLTCGPCKGADSDCCVERGHERPAMTLLQPIAWKQTQFLADVLDKRNVQAADKVITLQSTVTAAPAGTTTIVLNSGSTLSAVSGTKTSTITASLQMIPEELIISSMVDGSIVYTTKIVEPLIYGTSTVGSDGAWSSSTILSPGVTQSSLMTTLTEPISPSMTPCANNTSTDTQSYLNISTFSMTGYFTTQAPAWSSTWLSVGSETTTTPAPPIKTKELVTSTARLGSSSSAKAVDHDGVSVLVTTFAAIGACFLLALFL